MKRIISLTLVLSLLTGVASGCQPAAQPTATPPHAVEKPPEPDEAEEWEVSGPEEEVGARKIEPMEEGEPWTEVVTEEIEPPESEPLEPHPAVLEASPYAVKLDLRDPGSFVALIFDDEQPEEWFLYDAELEAAGATDYASETFIYDYQEELAMYLQARLDELGGLPWPDEPMAVVVISLQYPNWIRIDGLTQAGEARELELRADFPQPTAFGMEWTLVQAHFGFTADTVTDSGITPKFAIFSGSYDPPPPDELPYPAPLFESDVETVRLRLELPYRPIEQASGAHLLASPLPAVVTVPLVITVVKGVIYAGGALVTIVTIVSWSRDKTVPQFDEIEWAGWSRQRKRLFVKATDNKSMGSIKFDFRAGGDSITITRANATTVRHHGNGHGGSGERYIWYKFYIDAVPKGAPINLTVTDSAGNQIRVILTTPDLIPPTFTEWKLPYKEDGKTYLKVFAKDETAMKQIIITYADGNPQVIKEGSTKGVEDEDGSKEGMEIKTEITTKTKVGEKIVVVAQDTSNNIGKITLTRTK